MKRKLRIHRIYDIGVLMYLLYPDGSGETIIIPYIKSNRKLLESIRSEWAWHAGGVSLVMIKNRFERTKKRKKAIEGEIYHLPHSRLVILCDDINKKEFNIVIRGDKFPSFFELIENFHKGMRLVSREEKYKNLYQVYEELSVTPDPELKTIRHSISHPRKSLTSKKTIEILLNIFGDVKIDLQKYKHAVVFKGKLSQLYNLSEGLLIKEIEKVTPDRANVFKYYFIPKSPPQDTLSLKKQIRKQ